MSINAETRQRLLDLVYDLLTEEEAAALRRRIEREPDIALAYRQAQAMAEEIAQAARLKTAEIHLQRPASRRHGSSEGVQTRSTSSRVSSRTQIAHWVVGVGSVLLLLVSLWGYAHHRGQLSEIAAGQLRLVATGPARLQAGVANTFSVFTMDVKGTPLQSHVEIALYSANDRQLFRQKEETDSSGRVGLTIPPDINLLSGARLEIVATHENKVERIATTMNVEPVHYRTQLTTDRPVYRAGETVYYRSLTLSQFGLAADRDLSLQYEILGPAEVAVRDSSVIGQTKRGVGNGAFRLPDGLPAGRYHLLVRSLDKSFPQQRLCFDVLPSVAAPSTGAKGLTSPAKPSASDKAKIRVDFYPEGGELAAGLENRVYFAAQDGNGRPVDVRGTVVTRQGKSVVDVESTYQGMGTFAFFAVPEELYRLQLTSPAGASDGLSLPRVSAAQKVGLRTGHGVFASKSPLEFNVRSMEERLPLVAAAVCRGVLVAQTAFVARKGDNLVTLSLTPDVGGVIRLTVFSYSTARPEPLAERLVYRKPGRQMRIHVGEHPARYSPGEKVSLSLTATTESGEPVAATFGVSAVDEAALGAGRSEALSAPAYFLLSGDIDRPEDLEKADFFLSDKPQASIALDLLLGTQGWRKFVQEASASTPSSSAFDPSPVGNQISPPAMFDNLAEICAKYDQSLASFHEQQTATRRTVTVVSFFGGFGLVLLVAMLTLLKIISGIRMWVPALTAAVGCLAIGTLLMNPDRNQPALENNVAFTPYERPLSASAAVEPLPRPHAMPAAVEKRPACDVEPSFARIASAASESQPVATASIEAPFSSDRGEIQQDKFPVRYYAHHRGTGVSRYVETVFWHPLLVAGTNGRTQLEFELPESLARFRLRVDGHGAGRVGTAVDSLVARVPFRLTAKMPATMLVGDVIGVPIEMVDEIGQATPVEVTLEHVPPIKVEGSAVRNVELISGKTHREWFQIQTAGPKSQIPLRVRVKGGGHVDVVKHRLTAVMPGFPVRQGTSGRLEAKQELVVDLPDRWVAGTLAVSLTALPSGLANLQYALDGLQRSPLANLEQVLTLNYLHGLALKYLPGSGMVDLGIAKDARELLSHCDAQLAPFGSPGTGFGWLGTPPADEVMTAYALFQLRSAAQLSLLNPQLIERTAAWLDSRRNPNGSFIHSAKVAAGEAVTPDLADAYTIWMLAESGAKGIDAQLEHLVELGRKYDDPYLIALVAASLTGSLFDRDQPAMFDKLAKAQFPDGHLESKLGSITGARGPSLTVETTALAMWAWLDSPAHKAQVERAAEWLIAHRLGSGTFGSTQATMLAVQSLMEWTKADRLATREGKLTVRLAGAGSTPIGERSFPPGAQEPIVVGGLEASLKPGKNRLEVTLSGASRMPYVMSVAYHVDQRPVAKTDVLRLSTRLSLDKVSVGQSVDLAAELANSSSQELPFVVAVLRLPAGLEVSPEQASELKRSGVVDWMEVRAGEVICCWRSLSAGKTVSLKLRAMASMFGKTTSRPSQAYVCYQPELESWADPVTIEIRPE